GAVSVDEIGASIVRKMRKPFLVFLRDMVVSASTGGRRRWSGSELRRGRAVAIVMRNHDEIDPGPEPANVVAHALHVCRIDRDAVAGRDLRDARFGCRRKLIAVLVPA